MTDAGTASSLKVRRPLATPDRLRRLVSSRRILALLVTACLSLLLLACDSGGTLTISGPTGGTHFSTPTIFVTGTAPANAEVIQDISAGFDKRTLSDAQGKWRIEVELDVGDNVLTFRLADDPSHSTQKQILVVRDS